MSSLSHNAICPDTQVAPEQKKNYFTFLQTVNTLCCFVFNASCLLQLPAEQHRTEVRMNRWQLVFLLIEILSVLRRRDIWQLLQIAAAPICRRRSSRRWVEGLMLERRRRESLTRVCTCAHTWAWPCGKLQPNWWMPRNGGEAGGEQGRQAKWETSVRAAARTEPEQINVKGVRGRRS